jgi:hypothetical protein
MNPALWHYLREDKKKVHGWLQRVDAEIMGAIFEAQAEQGISGSCVEIGVHHGKSFIPLCMTLQDGEQALCIDVFDDQSKNLDLSGKGNLGVFQKNLAWFNIELPAANIIQASSEDVTPKQILDQVGPVRFFSIDGGHWSAIVQNDLRLAEATIASGGVVALDDYCRAEWPDVTYGYTLWQEATESDIIPFAIGSNKLFLCRKDYAKTYRKALKTPFLKHYLGKSYKSEIAVMDCYRVEPYNQDEESDQKMNTFMLKLFRPDKLIEFFKLK